MYRKKGQQGQAPTERHEERKVYDKDYKGPPRRRTAPPERQPKENITVTADTVVPPMPAKHELIAKPNWETTAYKAEYDNYTKEIEEVKKKMVSDSDLLYAGTYPQEDQ